MHLDDRSSKIILAVVTISLALAVGLIIPLASGARPGGTPLPWTPLPSRTPTPMSPTSTRVPVVPSLPQTPTPKPPTPTSTAKATATFTAVPVSPTVSPTRATPTPEATKTTPITTLPTRAATTPAQSAGAVLTLAQVNAGPLNLRAGPGADQLVLTTAAAGEVFTVTARTADDTWLEVCCVGGKPVWLSSSLVTITGTVTSLPIKP